MMFFRAPETGDKFRSDSPEFHGVLRVSTEGRLSVSPNGTRYLWQEPGPDGRFAVKRWRKSLALLLRDLPEDVAAWAAASLPDDPGAVERPWADDMKAASDVMRAANAYSDNYAGVIAADLEGLRVVFLPERNAYAVQAPGADGWRSVSSSNRMSRLLGLTYLRHAPDDRKAGMSRNGALQAALLRLPELAANFDGKARRRATEAQLWRKATRVADAEWRASGGPLRGRTTPLGGR